MTEKAREKSCFFMELVAVRRSALDLHTATVDHQAW